MPACDWSVGMTLVNCLILVTDVGGPKQMWMLPTLGSGSGCVKEQVEKARKKQASEQHLPIEASASFLPPSSCML